MLTLLKMSDTSLLCGPWADLWPLYGFYVNRFLSIVGANLRPFSFGGSVGPLRWSAQPW